MNPFWLMLAGLGVMTFKDTFAAAPQAGPLFDMHMPAEYAGAVLRCAQSCGDRAYMQRFAGALQQEGFPVAAAYLLARAAMLPVVQTMPAPQYGSAQPMGAPQPQPQPMPQPAQPSAPPAQPPATQYVQRTMTPEQAKLWEQFLATASSSPTAATPAPTAPPATPAIAAVAPIASPVQPAVPAQTVGGVPPNGKAAAPAPPAPTPTLTQEATK